MEIIITNPGLQHLAEKILWNLDVEHLKICGLINQSCQQILANPIFWLKKFNGLSEENQKDWINILKSLKNSEKKKAIISYLQWKLKKEPIDLPCYTSPAVQDDFRKKIWEFCKKQKSSYEDIKTFKIIAPLTDNPNSPNEYGDTPIIYAAKRGHTEIVKMFATLTDYNCNAPHKYGETPILMATCYGHTEIVKFLAPLTNNPNAASEMGLTPIGWAKDHGHTEIVQILKAYIPKVQRKRKRKA